MSKTIDRGRTAIHELARSHASRIHTGVLNFALLALLIPFICPLHAVASTALYSRGYTVLPEPQQVQLGSGDFEFGSGWGLELGAGVKADDVAVESLKDGLLRRYGIGLTSAGRGSKHVRAITLVIRPNSVRIGAAQDKNKSVLEAQAYRLELGSGGIQITANAPTGLLYGVDTLVQLVKPANGKMWLPQATITDWPDLELRNIFWEDLFHLDHVDVLKAAIRQAAFYKINGFVIKLNGHFQFKSAPALVEPYALSPAELQDLTDYGLRYHVQLIPYVDAPAHIPWILKHPEYASLREFPDSNYELCTTNPDSYKLLDGMYQDLLDANKGVNYFVLSTDEPYYVGLAHNSQCNEAQRAKQLGSVGKVLAEFLTKAAGYLHDRGRSVVFWGEYPLVPSDIPSLPSYLVSGEVYGPQFDRAFKAHGIRQMIYLPIEGVEPLFPNYYSVPPDRLLTPPGSSEEMAMIDRLHEPYHTVAFSSARRDSDLIGEFVAAWDASGLHPETFWLGYITAASWGWRPAAPEPAEAAASFYRLFYGQNAVDIGRLYQLMSTQAEFWESSWDSAPSSARKAIFGYSYGIFHPRHPVTDQTIPLPPVPHGQYLRLPYSWNAENSRRVGMARQFMPENEELIGLLHQNLQSAQLQHYNLEVFLSVAGLYRQNLQMLDELSAIDTELKAAEDSAARVEFADAVDSLDQALDSAKTIRDERNECLQNLIDIWYQSWDPRVAEANGRKFLNIQDDVKNLLGSRTVGMQFLLLREFLLPLDQWFDQTETARNQYARAHGLPLRTDKLNWAQANTP